MTTLRGFRWPGFAATLLIGLGLGWFAANFRPPLVRATMGGGGGDRFGDYVVLSAPVSLEYDERSKIQAPQDAVFFLDYRAARLLATIPTLKQSTSGTQVIDGFAERDLAADFKLDDARVPHFVMTAGSLGVKGALWAPVFVFETVSRQVAVYRLQPQAVGKRTQPKFDLLEVRSYLGESTLPELPGDPTTARPAK